MAEYPFIQTIRYMGNKGRLLGEIIPEIEKLTEEGDTVCDIMAGTNSVSYALKARNRLITNDIQFYSYVISRGMLESYDIPTKEQAQSDLHANFEKNELEGIFTFFADSYTDTYFAERQCKDVDSLRYAIEQIADENLKCFYLTVLMSAMCKAQSTTGHFAQFMDKFHKRIIPLRQLSVLNLFYDKIGEFKNFVKSGYNNLHFNLDYKELFKLKEMDGVKCFYLDSPYTTDQYSRFYHILETVCKYDYPTLEHKAKYRTDRVQSDFCYKKSVAGEFENIIIYCANKGASLVISYSNHGVIPVEDITAIAQKYYKSVTVKATDYEHSSQGKGTIDIKEVLIILK